MECEETFASKASRSRPDGVALMCCFCGGSLPVVASEVQDGHVVAHFHQRDVVKGGGVVYNLVEGKVLENLTDRKSKESKRSKKKRKQSKNAKAGSDDKVATYKIFCTRCEGLFNKGQNPNSAKTIVSLIKGVLFDNSSGPTRIRHQ